ncbi:hypothetical protein SDC9_169282 [bioreactor metagenome]|uniref:Uncharacterized protein n=1 Tax=bioreactor metagenome TaxID=1076179 RepID=A0A645G7E2_9ZZZZ
MEAQHPGFGIFGAKALAHDLRPQAAGGPEFGHLFQKVIMGRKEEGQLRGKMVYFQAGTDGCLDVFNGIGQGKGHLLHGRGPGFPDVIARNADGVPVGHFFFTILEDVRDQAQTGCGRENISSPRYIFFKDVILDGAAQLFGGHALFLAYGNVHSQ